MLDQSTSTTKVNNARHAGASSFTAPCMIGARSRRGAAQASQMGRRPRATRARHALVAPAGGDARRRTFSIINSSHSARQPSGQCQRAHLACGPSGAAGPRPRRCYRLNAALPPARRRAVSTSSCARSAAQPARSGRSPGQRTLSSRSCPAATCFLADPIPAVGLMLLLLPARAVPRRPHQSAVSSLCVPASQEQNKHRPKGGNATPVRSWGCVGGTRPSFIDSLETRKETTASRSLAAARPSGGGDIASMPPRVQKRAGRRPAEALPARGMAAREGSDVCGRRRVRLRRAGPGTSQGAQPAEVTYI